MRQEVREEISRMQESMLKISVDKLQEKIKNKVDILIECFLRIISKQLQRSES